MYYVGKSLDGFEYAVNSLLMRESLMPAAHLDCVSLRSFGFRCEGRPGGWFRPVIRWPEYLERVLRMLGCRGWYADADSFPVTGDTFQRWTLLGELPRTPFDHSVRSSFYPELSGFFLCRRREDGMLIVSDPVGAVYIEMEAPALAAILAQSHGFVMQLDGACPADKPDRKMILHEALAWHTRSDETAVFDFAANYQENVREKITLQYCLMNHQIQLSKVLKLAAETSEMDTAPLELLLADYPQIAMSGSVDALGALEKRFWDTLKEMEAGN